MRARRVNLGEWKHGRNKEYRGSTDFLVAQQLTGRPSRLKGWQSELLAGVVE